MADVSSVYQKAQQMFEKGQLDYAISLFSQCLSQDPNLDPAHSAHRAAVLRKHQQMGGPSRIKLMGLSAKTRGTLGVTKDARKRMDICLAHLTEDPNNAGVRATYATALLEAGYPDGAIAESRMVIEADPKSFDAWVAMGAALKSKGLPKEAQDAYQRALAMKPDDREIARELRNLAAMDSMKRSGIETAKDYRDTMKDKGKATELESAQHLIRTEDEVQGEINKTIEEFKQTPKDVQIARKVAELYQEKKKDYKTAREWYKKCQELAPQDSLFRDRADDCAMKMYDAQISALEKAGDARAKEMKAQKLKFELGSYERRVQDRPTDMALRFELGRLYYQIPALTDKAIAEFQQAVKDPKRKIDSHIYLGMCFQRKKLYDLADGQYERAGEGFVVDEKRLHIMYNRALCCAESGNLDKALELGKKIMEEDISYQDISAKVTEWMEKKKGG